MLLPCVCSVHQCCSYSCWTVNVSVVMDAETATMSDGWVVVGLWSMAGCVKRPYHSHQQPANSPSNNRLTRRPATAYLSVINSPCHVIGAPTAGGRFLDVCGTLSPFSLHDREPADDGIAARRRTTLLAASDDGHYESACRPTDRIVGRFIVDWWPNDAWNRYRTADACRSLCRPRLIDDRRPTLARCRRTDKTRLTTVPLPTNWSPPIRSS